MGTLNPWYFWYLLLPSFCSVEPESGFGLNNNASEICFFLPISCSE
jgi:hypothetical protein